MTDSPDVGSYAAPKLEILGQVTELTLDDPIDKKLGGTDGHTFLGLSISNASP
jgi:hypothetical protein